MAKTATPAGEYIRRLAQQQRGPKGVMPDQSPKHIRKQQQQRAQEGSQK